MHFLCILTTVGKTNNLYEATVSEHKLSLNIPHFEHYAFRKDYKAVFGIIKAMFEHVTQGNSLEARPAFNERGEEVGFSTLGFPPLVESDPLQKKCEWYQRIATVITIYLSDPEYLHSKEELAYINLLKPTLQDLFYLSSYGSMDHILWHRGIVDENNNLNLSANNAVEYLIACHTIFSGIKIDYKKLVGSYPSQALNGYIGLLTQFNHPYNEKATQNFTELFAQHEVLSQVGAPTVSHVARIIPGWMGCSYWDTNNRHDFKRSANTMIKNWLENSLSPGTKKLISKIESSPPRPIKRIVVAMEKYGHRHAMYRCYHSRIVRLKDEYEVILVSAENDFDDISKADFDQTVIVSNEISKIDKTARTILKLEPDLLLYPSLGMANWSIVTSNLRLAPIQAMSFGHPASAYNDTIDYALLGGTDGPDYQPFINEKLVPGRLIKPPPVLHPEYRASFKRQPHNDGTIRIAINSSLPKISPRVIALCQVLERESSKKLEFHFFAAINRGAQFSAFNKSVVQRLASPAIVHPVMPYVRYMDALSKIDLAIGSFPFGGSNTNIDLFLLGVPKVIYSEGSGIASYTDYAALKAIGLEKMLNCESEASLVAKCIYLIHNDNHRESISQLMLESRKKLDFNQSNTSSIQFVDAIKWIEQDVEAGIAE